MLQPLVEKAFQDTTEVLFGRRLKDLPSYAAWLSRHVLPVLKQKSPISGNSAYFPNMIFYNVIRRKLLPQEEALELGKHFAGEKDLTSITVSNAPKTLAPIKSISSDVAFGTNISMEESAVYLNSSHCFNVGGGSLSKFCAYCFWPRDSDHVFGCNFTFSSKFCINCYSSANLTRCFEMSDCNSCSDVYFSQNCDNLSNCMFCFNAKSLKYAVGNVEVGKEKYSRIRKLVLEDISSRLEKKKELELGIYEIGCWKKK